MKISLKWIQEYLNIKPNIALNDIKHALQQASFEIERVHHFDSSNLQYFSFVTITEISKHPNADTLQICKFAEVDSTVICGDPSIYIGMRTILAKPGAKVFDKNNTSFEIKRTKIRGIESEGMLCGESEIGLTNTTNGIINLTSDEFCNSTIDDIMNPYDTVLTVSMTPNRPDLMHPYGIARELACLGLGKAKQYPISSQNLQHLLGIQQYGYSLIFGMQIEDIVQEVSLPRYIYERITVANLKSVSDKKYDMYMQWMHEQGQQCKGDDSHQFKGDDSHQFKGDDSHQHNQNNDNDNAMFSPSMHVTTQNYFKSIMTLVTYVEHVFGYKIDVIPISTKSFIIALVDNFAECMNASNHIDSTQSVYEAYHQNNLHISLEFTNHTKQYTHHDIFGKISNHDCLDCMEYLMRLIRNTYSNIYALDIERAQQDHNISNTNHHIHIKDIYPDIYDACNDHTHVSQRIECIMNYATANLYKNGIEIPYTDCVEIGVTKVAVDRILTELGFILHQNTSYNALTHLYINDINFTCHQSYNTCIPPLWRTDIIGSQDILEEITRYITCDKIDDKPIVIDQKRIANDASTLNSITMLKNHLRCNGGIEVVNNDFMSKKICSMLNAENAAIAVQNPMSASQQYMRHSILGSILNTYSEYKRYNWNFSCMFEEGSIYYKARHDHAEQYVKTHTINTRQYIQQRSIGILFNPNMQDLFIKTHSNSDAVYIYAKKIFEQCISAMYSQYQIYTQHSDDALIYSNKCLYYIKINDISINIGCFGIIDSSILRSIKCNHDCISGEIYVYDCLPKIQNKSVISSNHKVVTKDISFEIDENIWIDDAINIFRSIIPQDIQVQMLDIYPNYDKNIRKTITMRLIWNNLQEVMTTEQIKSILDTIYMQIENSGFKAK